MPTGFCHLDSCWRPCPWLKQYSFVYIKQLIRMEIAILPTWRLFCLFLSKLSIYQNIHMSCFHLSSWIIKVFIFTISCGHAYVCNGPHALCIPGHWISNILIVLLLMPILSLVNMATQHVKITSFEKWVYFLNSDFLGLSLKH